MEKAYHHGNLHEALVSGALDWLDSRGEVPSLRALAAAVGVSHAAPYRHFANAQDLHGAVATAAFDALTRRLIAASDAAPTPLAGLDAGCRAYIEWGLAYPARYRLMFEHGGPPLEHAEAVAASLRAFEVLKDNIGRLGIAPTGLAAFVAWTSLHGVVTLLAATGPKPVEMVQDPVFPPTPVAIDAVVAAIVAQIAGAPLSPLPGSRSR